MNFIASSISTLYALFWLVHMPILRKSRFRGVKLKPSNRKSSKVYLRRWWRYVSVYLVHWMLLGSLWCRHYHRSNKAQWIAWEFEKFHWSFSHISSRTLVWCSAVACVEWEVHDVESEHRSLSEYPVLAVRLWIVNKEMYGSYFEFIQLQGIVICRMRG